MEDIVKKIKELEREKFILEMKDRFSHDDYRELDRLNRKIRELKMSM